MLICAKLYLIQYRANHWYYGALITMFSFMPLLVSTISSMIRKKEEVNQVDEEDKEENDQPKTYLIIEGKWEFLWQTPFINAIRNFILLKELIKAKDEKDEVKIDTKIQNFRIYQQFCDIIPINVLLMAYSIRDQELGEAGVVNENKIAYIDSLSTVGLILSQKTTLFITFILEYLTVISIAETFIYMPIFLKTDLTRNKILHQTRKALLFVLPLITLIFSPRLLVLSLFFGVWRGLGCLLTFVGAVVIYTFGFIVLVCTKYRKEWKENSRPLLQSFVSSFFAPCIIMYPESKLVFWMGLVSLLPHLFLISALLFMANHYPDELFPKIAPEAFNVLVLCILIAPVFSWLLKSYSEEKTQKILLGALSFKLIKFFVLSIILCALDELTDILSAMDYFR